LITVVRVTSLSRVELPRNSAINMISNKTPPTTHIQGCIYQVVVVVVVVGVVVVVVLAVPSCAFTSNCIEQKASTIHNLQAAPAHSFFISVVLNKKIRFNATGTKRIKPRLIYSLLLPNSRFDGEEFLQFRRFRPCAAWPATEDAAAGF
jgi:hypothetical protein